MVTTRRGRSVRGLYLNNVLCNIAIITSRLGLSILDFMIGNFIRVEVKHVDLDVGSFWWQVQFRCTWVIQVLDTEPCILNFVSADIPTDVSMRWLMGVYYVRTDGQASSDQVRRFALFFDCGIFTVHKYTARVKRCRHIRNFDVRP
jgi:hypothetical protein